MFDSLQLDVVYQPADSALDVAATLYDLGSETAQSAAQDWSVPPVGFEPTHPAPEAGAGPLRECPLDLGSYRISWSSPTYR